jgi:hypothetical protein
LRKKDQGAKIEKDLPETIVPDEQLIFILDSLSNMQWFDALMER